MHDLDSSPLNGTCWPDWDLHILPRMPEVGDQRSNDFQTTNIGCKGTFTFQINGKLRIKQNQPSITRSPCDPRISSHSLDSSFQQIPWTTPRPARRWVFLMNTCTIEALENQGIQPLTIFEFVRSLIRSQWTCYTLRHTSRTLGKAINIYIYIINEINKRRQWCHSNSLFLQTSNSLKPSLDTVLGCAPTRAHSGGMELNHRRSIRFSQARRPS